MPELMAHRRKQWLGQLSLQLFDQLKLGRRGTGCGSGYQPGMSRLTHYEWLTKRNGLWITRAFGGSTVFTVYYAVPPFALGLCQIDSTQ